MTRTPSDLSPIRRFATASWPLFTAFGVRVRVHWTTVFVPLAIYAGLAPHRSSEETALLTTFFTVATYLVIWTHEMGHVWAGRGVGVETRQITLQPLGGIAHAQSSAPSPRAEIWIALAGPLTHAFWFVLAGAPFLLLHAPSAGVPDATPGDLRSVAVEGFLWTNAVLLFVNLLPFWPMDGGRVVRASLSLRMHPNHASLLAAYAGFAGATVLAVTGVAVMFEADPTSTLASIGGPVLVFIGVSNFVACRGLLLEARWGDSPYDRIEPRRAVLPQATWSYEEPTPSEPIHLDERLDRRVAAQPRQQQQRRREPARAPVVPIHERIDQLLDRINEVGGVEHLTESERTELAEASEKLRAGDR